MAATSVLQVETGRVGRLNGQSKQLVTLVSIGNPHSKDKVELFALCGLKGYSLLPTLCMRLPLLDKCCYHPLSKKALWTTNGRPSEKTTTVTNLSINTSWESAKQSALEPHAHNKNEVNSRFYIFEVLGKVVGTGWSKGRRDGDIKQFELKKIR